MKHTSANSEALPTTLKHYVHVLKTEVPPLPESARLRLQSARAAALAKHASQLQATAWMGPLASVLTLVHPLRTLSWVSVGVFVLLIAVLWAGRASTEDALMLGDDFPIDAFVDNGFEPWQQTQSNN